MKKKHFKFQILNFNLFLFVLLMLNSCILESSEKNNAENENIETLSNLITDSENDFYKDTINYNLLEVSKDSVDIELLNLIRDEKNYSEKKLLENVKILIDKGANPNNNIEETWSSKRIVAKVPILKHFVKRKYNTGVKYTTAFHSAVNTGRTDLIDLFYDLGFNANTPTKSKVYPINIAMEDDNEKMIDFLLEKNANIKILDLSVSGNTNLIVKLVNLGANPKTIDINYALDNATDLEKLLALKPNLTNVELNFGKLFRNQEVFNLLINNGLNPNIEGKFPFNCNLLYGAIKFGTIENIKIIIKKGGNYKTECQMQFYASPLIASIKLNDTSKIAYFIDLGISLNSRDWKGDTPLSEAVTKDNDVLINFLIKKGAKVNYPMERGETLIMLAVKRDKYISAETLIENGAELNSVEKYGKTCLVFAIQDNNLAMIKLLLENNADKTKKYKGKSLAQFAEEESASSKIIELLKDF